MKMSQRMKVRHGMAAHWSVEEFGNITRLCSGHFSSLANGSSYLLFLPAEEAAFCILESEL
jgi:hypothetical protein